MQFLGIFSVLQVALCADPIRFLGSPTAKSSDFDSNTILYDNPISPQINSTQFLYEIITKESSVDVGLATVYLNGHGNKIELQNKFSVISQPCKCYWLSAVDLKKNPGNLTSGTEYFISIESESEIESKQFNVRSGTFGLNFASDISSPSSSTTTENPVIDSGSSPSLSNVDDSLYKSTESSNHKDLNKITQKLDNSNTQITPSFEDSNIQTTPNPKDLNTQTPQKRKCLKI